MVDKFNLTRDNAKEYFFLNQCRLRNIDRGDTINSDKFRSYGIDNTTLDSWTNEWLNSELNNTDLESDVYEFYSLVSDLGYRMSRDNAEKTVCIYNGFKGKISDRTRTELLFRHDFYESLNKHYYHGLIYIAVKNKMTEYIDALLSELNDLLKEQPQEIRKEYEKSLKRLFKEYKIK